jgi:prepilin-type N-terminal cleavage/methylation domain-containing protein
MRWGDQSGLTLLELLVGLVLLSLLLAVISQASGSILRSWQWGQENFSAEPEIFAAKRIIRRQIISATPYNPDPRGGRVAAFWGNQSQVTFVSSQSLGSRAQMGLWFVRYSLEPQSSGDLALVGREWSARNEVWWEQATVPAQPVVLVGGVKSGRMEYQLYDERTRQYQYLNSWGQDQQGKLPQSIRLVMGRAEGEWVWEFPLACGGNRVYRVRR